MDEGQHTETAAGRSPPGSGSGRVVARAAGRVGHHVDRAAGQVERLADGVVERASAIVAPRRGGSYAVALLVYLRDGVVFMLRDWRLMLLQVPAAVTVSVLLYRLRVRALGIEEIVTMPVGALVAVVLGGLVVLAVTFACGTVFAFAMTATPPGQRADLGQAWLATKQRWRRLAAWTVAADLGVVGLLFLARSLGRAGYTAVSIVALCVLIAFIALVPLRVSSARTRRTSARDRAWTATLGSSASVLLEAPTIGMAEVGRLFARVPGLRLLGWVAIVVGGLLHMAAASSVRALKLSTKLATHHAEEGPVAAVRPAPPEGGPGPG